MHKYDLKSVDSGQGVKYNTGKLIFEKLKKGFESKNILGSLTKLIKLHQICRISYEKKTITLYWKIFL